MQVDSLNEKLPIGSVSGGISRFLSIVIGIASIPNGVLLIDEFEGGFYYAHLPEILEKICSFCETCNVQVFASTHSYEFLQRMLPVMRKRRDTANEFTLLRSIRSANECTVTAIGDPSAAIESNFEVR